MSHVVWLSRSIKIVLLSVLFLQEISHVSVHRELKQTKSEDISGQVLWGTVLWYEQRESKVHHCWRVESFFFFSSSACLLLCSFPFLCLPSSMAQPCSLPCCSSGAHRSVRFWWLVSMSINWEISYYHENDFILRWTILYHLLYLSHCTQCCTLGRQINLSSWNVYCFI